MPLTWQRLTTLTATATATQNNLLEKSLNNVMSYDILPGIIYIKQFLAFIKMNSFLSNFYKFWERDKLPNSHRCTNTHPAFVMWNVSRKNWAQLVRYACHFTKCLWVNVIWRIQCFKKVLLWSNFFPNKNNLKNENTSILLICP